MDYRLFDVSALLGCLLGLGTFFGGDLFFKKYIYTIGTALLINEAVLLGCCSTCLEGVLLINGALAFFSLAGIPPLSGPFDNLVVLFELFAVGEWYVLFIFILLSTVGVVYYLRVLKLATIDESGFNTVLVIRCGGSLWPVVLTGGSLFNVLLCTYPFPLGLGLISFIMTP